MDRRTQRNLRLFLIRFRRNYTYFLQNYAGKNLPLYMDQFVHDNMKLAQTLFGDEGARTLKNYTKNLRTF
ncbi:MAG: hypothetical protein K2X86_13795 [Cytophagaceae bacterium]|nr:hypothetical protein [Cytophagaceae bacterium]